MINADLTVRQLLEALPEGFSVGPNGDVSKTLMATSHFSGVAMSHPIAPQNGGYLVVEMIDQSDLPSAQMTQCALCEEAVKVPYCPYCTRKMTPPL